MVGGGMTLIQVKSNALMVSFLVMSITTQATLIFEDPQRHYLLPQLPSVAPFREMVITTLQEDISYPGRFFVTSPSRLFYLYRDTADWVARDIVGTDTAACIDGNFTEARLCPVTRLIQLQRNYTATSELVMASQHGYCLKLIDLNNREVRPFSKSSYLSSLVHMAEQNPDRTLLLNTTFYGPTGLSTQEENGTVVMIFVSEYRSGRIKVIDLENQTVSILMDLSGQEYAFKDMLRYDESTFLLLSFYGIVEANLSNGTARYIFGGSKYDHDLITSSVDGNFSVASLFRAPSFLRLTDSRILIASVSLRRLRLVDLNKKTVETVCVHKSPRTLRFKSEDFRLMRKCNIFKPASLALINGTVYVGDTSVLSMKFHNESMSQLPDEQESYQYERVLWYSVVGIATMAVTCVIINRLYDRPEEVAHGSHGDTDLNLRN